MEGRVAQGRAATRIPRNDLHWLDILPSALIGAGLVVAALAAYWLPGSVRIYNHFVWQAAAFLDGQAAIPWPVPGNNFQDFFPLTDAAGNRTGFGLLPFPPLPAIVLMPFVALWGLATDERAVSVVVGAIDVGLCWWMLGRLPVDRMVRLAVTIFFGFGTVVWYAAGLGTTWFFAHVVALAPLLAAVGLALGGDRSFAADAEPDPGGELEEAHDNADAAGAEAGRPLGVVIVDSLPAALAETVAGLRSPLAFVDRRQFVAGLLFGLACTARLTIVFGAPFFMLVGSGGSLARRSISAGLGAIIPVGLLLAYNIATTGQLFHPGYEYLYQLEANGYRALGYNPAWSIEDVRYLPQNLGIMFLSTPAILPSHGLDAFGGATEALCAAENSARGLFDPACPIAIPRAIGMSIILTSPAFLYLVPALGRIGRSRLVAGAALAVVSVAIVNLMHFSQGWVQFGYRFSNDFVVFAVPLVALGMARRGGVRLLAGWLVGASVAINFWGVTWGNLFGW
ncbi:MAG: hypothetical protein EPO36_13850 [Chloroflexota bacterium]|nr:MAG: hypothetical protein EPO36_13850 [Chloroflexota bacterium]